ncbi:protein PELOTA 1-like [Quercus robur]|uniref:protein PELOTA 1-like n=1 Tax=Quercus robur TaxID=38942 RepID=UPI002162D6DE|nr:protein PELOTA 1-like [Quercus robur]
MVLLLLLLLILSSDKLFENVFHTFVKHVDFSTIRCVVIGSPGCVKDEFRGYLLPEAQRLKLKSIEDKKSRIVVATTSPSNTHNLSEVLNDNAVINLIRETNVVLEIRAFKEFLDMVTSNSDRACYGSKSVETAHEMLAIETLLITDDLSGALRLRRGISMLGWLSQ